MENNPKEGLTNSHVRYGPTHDDHAAAPTKASSSDDNVKHEIENLLNQVNKLLEKAPKDDPAFKESVKKLIFIKKTLEEKATSPSVANILNKLYFGKKKAGGKSSNEDHHESDDPHFMEHMESRTGEQKQDIINMNLDDSILQGVDGLISFYEYIANIFKKTP